MTNTSGSTQGLTGDIVKEIKSVEFAKLLNISVDVFAKLRKQGALPSPIQIYYNNKTSGAKITSWPENVAKVFAKKFDHKAMNKKYGFKKTILERKKTGSSDAQKFNDLMRSM